MNVQDFSDRFDTLLNSFAAKAQFGEGEYKGTIVLDEYEKSVFLTQAQNNLVISLYTGKNEYGYSFEEKELIREAIDTLVGTYTTDITVPDEENQLSDGKHYFTFFDIPENLLWIIWEQAVYPEGDCPCRSMRRVPVIPTTHDELHTKLENPFRGPKCRRVLRLNASDNRVELVSDYPIGSYVLRYIREPQPIVLTNLTEDLNIDYVTEPQTSELPEVLHERILNDAVRLAIQSRVASTRSE